LLDLNRAKPKASSLQ